MINISVEEIKMEKQKLLKRIAEIYDEINIYLKRVSTRERKIFFRPTESDLKARELVDELEILTNKLSVFNDIIEGNIKFNKVGVCNE